MHQLHTIIDMDSIRAQAIGVGWRGCIGKEMCPESRLVTSSTLFAQPICASYVRAGNGHTGRLIVSHSVPLLLCSSHVGDARCSPPRPYTILPKPGFDKGLGRTTVLRQGIKPFDKSKFWLLIYLVNISGCLVIYLPGQTGTTFRAIGKLIYLAKFGHPAQIFTCC